MSTVTELDRPPNAVTVHEPYGFVALVSQHGDDLDIVNAARVSYAKQSGWDEVDPKGPMLSEADAGLIGFLIKNRHGTPFEQNYFQFHVSAPIFLFREWHRHRVGVSINEVSGRYVELQPRFYLPDDEHVRVQVGRPGHYTYVSKGAESVYGLSDGSQTYGSKVRIALKHSYEIAFSHYQQLLELGVAKELARACLPVATYSEMLWSCNARSLMAFLSLRNHDRALRELRDYAAVMEDLFAQAMPVTHAAFVANERTAP